MKQSNQHKKIILVLIAAALLALAGWFLLRRQPSNVLEPPRAQTQEEILSGLAPGSDAEDLPEIERSKILESLRAPSP